MRPIARLLAGGLGIVVLFFGLRVVSGVEPIQLDELRLVLDKLRTENADLKSQLELRDTVIRNLQESLAVARTESEMFQRKWTEAQLRAQTLGANPNDSEASAAQRQLAEAIRQLALAQAECQRLTAQLERLLVAVQSNTDLRAEIEATQALLAAMKRSTTAPTAFVAGRLEAAKVLDVNPKLRVAVLNVGAEQGVRIGMPFQVERDERVVATVRVVEVRPQVCGALIESAEKGVTLQAGDTAKVTKSAGVTPR